jgi:hypothetical protein
MEETAKRPDCKGVGLLPKELVHLALLSKK